MSHIWNIFTRTVERHPDCVAHRQRHGNTWEFDVLTYSELYQIIVRKAAALKEHGINAQDRVAILSNNSSEWVQADLAIMSLGAISVPIYPTSTSEQIAHIMRDCQVEAVLAQNDMQLAKIAQIADQFPNLKLAVTLEKSEQATHWEQLQPQFEQTVELVKNGFAKLNADDVATIIYTSGTTGAAKGATLSHANLSSQFQGLNRYFTLTTDDTSLSFLPLSHAFERAWSLFVMSHGCAITFVDNPKQVAEFLHRVRPTLFVSVPRLYEKVQQTAKEAAAASSLKKAVFEWALRVGGRNQRAYRKGKKPALFWRIQLPLADRLVLRQIRDALGGPKTAMASGGAPLRPEVEEFISAAGLMLCCGYGMTECSPLISFNAPGDFKVGTVGRVMAGGQIKIGVDSEIYYKGPNVMSGYWNNAEATAAAIDSDGWIHTGDVGYVDNQGYLVITDRKKDILVTSGGKNIAPQPIEGEILSDSFFEHAVLLGNDRPFVTALLRPSVEQLEAMAAQLQLRWQNREELLDNEQLRAEIQERLRKLTEKLPSHEQIKDFRITLEEFTQENGLLTPTLKVKRKEVETRFKDMIDDMYAKLAAKRKANK